MKETARNEVNHESTKDGKRGNETRQEIKTSYACGRRHAEFAILISFFNFFLFVFVYFVRFVVLSSVRFCRPYRHPCPGVGSVVGNQLCRNQLHGAGTLRVPQRARR
jgi:hypothetical protein